ncbi:9a741081-77ae-4704-b6ff-5111685aea1d [Thermothielavioides terrestris]|uniref:Serine hydrolase domain-containing protein n=2 Tax=Thermothielavioides terrestris TaxID=2587410 RepID=G2R323_THETT|nr:uncharacterized protein THITE_2115098 [Thermothielavioides terrestris NRRL 8126]AEO66741.1 hypothetical protein THITE_2115098 [Thermothielavioides terrestris NRRL 8126]SPQ20038.1 9a741081-77ae-4704-b6ff-5111685aea1d [Thermothielavioides terrestris]
MASSTTPSGLSPDPSSALVSGTSSGTFLQTPSHSSSVTVEGPEEPRKIRILGLHGMGTSAEIFKSQTSAFRSKLPPHFTFVFIDAPFPCAPAPGAEVLFTKRAYYAWWKDQTPNAIKLSHLAVTDYIERHGPFDILMGFSQGCALISSYLLYHARETPDKPLPFQAAVFICGGVPLPALEDLGVDVTQRARDINEKTARGLRKKALYLFDYAANPNLIERGVGLWDDVSDLVHKPDQMPDETDVFGLDFTTMPKDLRIKIPTVHVYGAKDPRWPASLQLAHFCDQRKLYDHGGGHEIPRTSEVSSKIAELISGLVEDTQREKAPAVKE